MAVFLLVRLTLVLRIQIQVCNYKSTSLCGGVLQHIYIIDSFSILQILWHFATVSLYVKLLSEGDAEKAKNWAS